METTSTENKGFIPTVTSGDGAGIFAFIYAIIAIGLILAIVIFG
jgi:hypothetical protein